LFGVLFCPIAYFDLRWYTYAICLAHCNALELRNKNGEQFGAALFNLGSLMNHSCVPNTTIETQGRELTVRATRHIAVNEAILHSYVDEKLSVEERARKLEVYGFTCKCNKCTTERMKR